jgi:DegV family protein with EDD domain
MGVAVVTDTTHYLPRELVAARGLHEVSLYVGADGDLRREADVADLEGFYARLREQGSAPTTSQPSIGDFLAVYEPLLAAGHDIVSVHLSAGISGTVATAGRAREQLDPQRITVVDSATTGGGLGFVALAAARAAGDGADLAGVAEAARVGRVGLRQWFCLDTLEFLRRGGRIGRAQAWAGGALRVKPILAIESEIVPVERVRTAGRAFERMVRFLSQLRDEGRDGWAVQHIGAPDQAARLVERGRELLGCEPVYVSEVGPVIGAHVGPGLLAVGGVPRALL